jgi:dihydroorotase
MKVIFKNARLLDPERKLDETGDLLVEEGVIRRIGGTTTEDDANGAEVIDREGLIVAPGFFDMHVHLREPGREDVETVASGLAAAANGGFTGVAYMPNTEPAIDSAETIALVKEKARGSLAEAFPIAAVSVGRKGEALSPMAELVEAGAVAFSDDGAAVASSALLRRALEYSNMFGVPIVEHCEDPDLAGGAMNEGYFSTIYGLPGVPTVAEDVIVARGVLLAEFTGGAFHVAHVSSKRSIELVRDAKARGIRVTAEITPHHFTLVDEDVKTYDTNFKMNPPLRSREDLEAALEGLKDGTIDAIASDHAPHAPEDKEREFIYAPNGVLGLETAVPLALTELVGKKVLSIETTIEKFALGPRRILNLPIPKIAEGEPANLTVIDPAEVWTYDAAKSKSKSRNTPFDKRLFTGKPVAAMNQGKLWRDGEMRTL